MGQIYTSQLVEKDNIKAIIMGTRRTDPYSLNLSSFAMSDVGKGWAPFMRINPILDWHYKDVWDFLLGSDFPVCSLYFKGYTYLGNARNSIVNPFFDNEEKKKDPRNCPGQFETLSRSAYHDSSSKMIFRPIFIAEDVSTLGEFLKENEGKWTEQVTRKIKEQLPESISDKAELQVDEITQQSILITKEETKFLAEDFKTSMVFVAGVHVDALDIKKIFL